MSTTDRYAKLGQKQAQSATRAAASSSGAEFVKIPFWNEVCDSSGTPLTEWKPKLGDNFFDIMPYIATSNNFKNEKGEIEWEIQVMVNLKLAYGLSKNQAKRTVDLVSRAGLGLPDPVADEQARLFDIASPGGVKNKTCAEWKEACALYPKLRTLYIIMVYSDDKKTRKPYLFAPAYESFGALLEKQHRSILRKGRDVIWSHPTEGMTIYLEGENKTFTPPGGQPTPFVGYSAVEAEARIAPYPEDICEKIPALDAAIIIPTLDEAYMALTGTTPGEAVQETVQIESTPAKEDIGTFAPAGTSETTVVETKVEAVKAPEEKPAFLDDIPF